MSHRIRIYLTALLVFASACLLPGCDPVPEGNYPGECSDSEDNDVDGLTDCDDPDCAASSICLCANPFADVDFDGDVDSTDFAVLQLCYTDPGDPVVVAGSICDCLDREDADEDGVFDAAFDGDGKIDSLDFFKFAACASGAAVPADPTCDDLP